MSTSHPASPTRRDPSSAPSGLLRLTVSLATGAAVGLVCWVATGLGWKSALVGWDLSAALFVGSVWLEARRYDGRQTADHALRDDPGRHVTTVIVVVAAVLSLAADVAVLAAAGQAKGAAEVLLVGLGLISLVLSWTLVHVLFTLKYAQRYFREGGGVDFEGAEVPDYGDFAYLSFTIGMCYQVSDTGFTSSSMRRLALRHSLLSYLFGAAILASAINIIAGLSTGN